MVKIDDDFWPASLAHLIKPYMSDSSQYVTIGKISSEPLDNFPGTRLLYTAMVPANEADECLARPGGIGHGISHLAIRRHGSCHRVRAQSWVHKVPRIDGATSDLVPVFRTLL